MALSHSRRSSIKPHLVKSEGKWMVLPMFYRTPGYMDKYIKACEWAYFQNYLNRLEAFIAQESKLEMFRND